jgi:hypothetical protein
MAGVVKPMNEPAEPVAPEPAIEEVPKPKRISGYDRMKRKNRYLSGTIAELGSDVSALENLVETLLTTIGTLTARDVTIEDIDRARRIATGIRAALATDDDGVPAS